MITKRHLSFVIDFLDHVNASLPFLVADKSRIFAVNIGSNRNYHIWLNLDASVAMADTLLILLPLMRGIGQLLGHGVSSGIERPNIFQILFSLCLRIPSNENDLVSVQGTYYRVYSPTKLLGHINSLRANLICIGSCHVAEFFDGIGCVVWLV